MCPFREPRTERPCVFPPALPPSATTMRRWQCSLLGQGRGERDGAELPVRPSPAEQGRGADPLLTLRCMKYLHACRVLVRFWGLVLRQHLHCKT